MFPYDTLLGLPLEEALSRLPSRGIPVVRTSDPHGHGEGTERVVRAGESGLVTAVFRDAWPGGQDPS